MAAEEQAIEEQAEGRGRALLKQKPVAMIGLLAGIMVLEGVLIFAGMKFFGADPDPTQGMMDELAATTKPYSESVELEVAGVKAQNTNGDRTTLYSTLIYVRVNHEHAEMVLEFLENREATIYDTISTILRSADQKHLSEPGLETFKRMVRHELNTLLMDDQIIEEVLLKEFTPLPTGF